MEDSLNSKVTVTGGAGFLGSHLCEALADLGQEITVLDNLTSGTKDNIRQTLKCKDHVELVVGDCKNPQDVRRTVSEADIVYHFAASPEVRLELADPSTCFRENVYATQVLLEGIMCTHANIVFASTSTVYGDANSIPTPENYSPLQPISVYGASKLASEALIGSHCHTYKRRAVILRLANIVGARSKHGVISDFVVKLRRNPKRLEILGDGHQRKSYLHVEDCIKAILKACETAEQAVEVFNVGSDDQVEVARIAEIVAEEMGLEDVRFSFTGGVNGGRGWIGDVKNMLLDTTKLKARGWKPQHGSEEAVRLATKSIVSGPLRNRARDATAAVGRYSRTRGELARRWHHVDEVIETQKGELRF